MPHKKSSPSAKRWLNSSESEVDEFCCVALGSSLRNIPMSDLRLQQNLGFIWWSPIWGYDNECNNRFFNSDFKLPKFVFNYFPCANFQDMGGTRKGESITRIADNILQNYRKYTVGLHAKVARKRDGHGASSVSSLISLGRRLLSVDFVLYTILFKDIVVWNCCPCNVWNVWKNTNVYLLFWGLVFACHLTQFGALSFQDIMERQRVFTLSVQQRGSLPWIPEQFFQRKQGEIEEDLIYLGQLRQLISVATLLQHYVDKASLQAFLQAHLYTPFGKRYQCCMQSLYSMIVHRRFHGVDLQTFTELHSSVCLPCSLCCSSPWK